APTSAARSRSLIDSRGGRGAPGASSRPPARTGAGCAPPRSACLPEHLGLLLDAAEQVFPRLDERRGAVLLELQGEGIDVDPRLAEAADHRLAVATVPREERSDLTVVGEREQGLLRQRIDPVWRCQTLDVEEVG